VELNFLGIKKSRTYFQRIRSGAGEFPEQGGEKIEEGGKPPTKKGEAISREGKKSHNKDGS